MSGSLILSGAKAEGSTLVCEDPLSLWGGVDPATGTIVDRQHPQCGASLSQRVVLMPTSRGSCSGAGVLLELVLSGRAPQAFIFRAHETTLTLGALVAAHMFGKTIPIVRLPPEEYDALLDQPILSLHADAIHAGTLRLSLTKPQRPAISLSAQDQQTLSGAHGKARQVALQIVVAMAELNNATHLTDVSRVHIDGCIYAAPAFLTFANLFCEWEAQVKVPTTLNAVSVDLAGWQAQGVDAAFGTAASRLAECYVSMGAAPTFTCAPYLLEDAPKAQEAIAWAESNAVVYANSVLGARTEKHPDFLDLCIALTGRAPRTGVYRDRDRQPTLSVSVDAPDNIDDVYWPLLGWLVGELAQDRIPIVHGLEHSAPTTDSLKALCAAFGTTAAAPMLHVANVTPEAMNIDDINAIESERVTLGARDFARLWDTFNQGTKRIDLVALGSPHFSSSECHAFLALLDGRTVHPEVHVMITLGRHTSDAIGRDGTCEALEALGVTLIVDVCWCSITEPVFPPSAKVVMTNSGKYAHYGPGLSGRVVRLGGLADCAIAALTGRAPGRPPAWMQQVNLNEPGVTPIHQS